MKYNNLNKDELISKIEKLELDLIKSNSNNENSEKAKAVSKQQNSLLRFINSMAIPSADKSSVEEFSKVLLNAVKAYTGANLATFSLYQPDKKELALLHIDAEHGILKTGLKIAGDKIEKMVSPVDDETYEAIIRTIVTRCSTFNEVSFGTIPKFVDKALRTSTGIDRMYPIAHVIEGELYGTTLLAFKKGQASPSIELLESYAHLMSVSLRRYNAERALQVSEIKYRTYIEHAPLGISVADNKGQFTDLNPGICELLGYTQEELLQLSIPDFLADEKDMAGFDKLKEEGKLEQEFNVKKKDGTVISVSLSAVLVPDNQSIAFTSDITERKKAEKEIKESQKRLSEAERIGEFGNWSNDLATGTIEWSDGLYRVFGLAPEQQVITYELMMECIHEDDRDKQNDYFEQMQGLLPGQKLEPLEYRIVIPSGKIRWIEVDFETQFDRDNKPKSFFGTAKDITELKQSEIKFQKSEQKHELLIKNSPDMLMRQNTDGKVTYVSPQCKDILGFTIDEIMNLDVQKQIYPEDLEITIENTIKALNGAVLTNFEYRFIKKDGEIVWLSHNARPIIIEDKISEIQSTIRDVTKRKMVEYDLVEARDKAEQSSANITAIIEGTNHSIWAFNSNYQILYINRIFQEEFLKSFGVLLEPGMSVVEALPESLRPLWKPRYDRVLANEQYTVEDAIPIDNDTVYLEVSFNPIVKNGEVIGGSCFGSNITSRKQGDIELITAKEKAEESERKLVEAQKLAQVGNWEYIIDTDTVSWSKEIFNIFERSHDLPAPTYSEQRLFYTKESFALLDKAFQDCVQRAIPYELELDIIVSNGSTKQIIAKGNVIKDKSNKIIGSYGTAQDITQKKKNEREIIIAKEKAEESDRLKSAFLANMSHEIRTPMNGILGFSSLLKEPKLSGEQQEKYISIIEKSGARMLNIINDIIDISKIEAGLMTMDIVESDINEQLEYIYTFFRPEVEAKGMKLILKNTLPSQEALIKTDREKVFAVLTNLVKNAVKYSNEGLIEMGYSKKGDALEFYVKDSGIGIKSDRQEAIFERFIQADIADVNAYQGAGLGLSISKAYVEMLGGKLWVESEKDKGSTFYFTIPYTTEIEETVDIVNNATEGVPKLQDQQLKILIVEDDEISDLLISTMLQDVNREILHAQNGLEAIEICRNNPDLDLILMDVKMPVLGGYEATLQIREFNKAVIVIAQTAYGLSGDREKAIEAGCNDYITKPINQTELLLLIQKHFK